MGIIVRKLVLTGGRAGLTGVLAKTWPARNGVITINGDAKSVDGLTTYLGKRYKAFPEGSAELAHFQAVDRGKSHIQDPVDSPPATAGDSGVQSGQQGTTEVPTADGAGANTAPVPAQEHGAQGNGQPDPGHDRTTGLPEAIRTAIAQLDPADDECWTFEGMPKVEVLAAAVGKPDLSRREINEHAPGAVRPTG